jgi:hypothetical protein
VLPPSIVRIFTAAPGAATCAVPPLATVASWLEIGGEFNDQFPGVNQLLVALGGPCQISCAYKMDDPMKIIFSVTAIGQHLRHRKYAKNRVEDFTISRSSRFLTGIAILAFAICKVLSCIARLISLGKIVKMRNDPIG